MTPESIIDLFRTTLFTVTSLIFVIIMPGLIVGLLVSIFQAATQINEQTLSFVPRLLVTFLSLIIFGPWLLATLIDFTHKIMSNISEFLV